MRKRDETKIFLSSSHSQAQFTAHISGWGMREKHSPAGTERSPAGAKKMRKERKMVRASILQEGGILRAAIEPWQRETFFRATMRTKMCFN